MTFAADEMFRYIDNRLHAESVDLEALAHEHGTPCYVYSRLAIEERWRAFDSAFADTPHLVCYAVKANGNLAVLDTLARLGSGFDIVSSGELQRVLRAGGEPARTVFAGVGKTGEEVAQALRAGVACINVESAQELQRVSEVAVSLGIDAPVSLRVNPDVDAQTHPYISTGLRDNKFGIPIGEAPALYRHGHGLPGLRMVGVDCHIGSQLVSLAPMAAALERVLRLVDALRGDGLSIEHVNVGGGMGIRYRDEQVPEPRALAEIIGSSVRDRGLSLLCEPGRAIVGNAGVLLTRVQYLKSNGDKHFAVVDAAMNDLLRPALYQAWQGIDPVNMAPRKDVESRCYDVVGPVCESADFLGKDRDLALVQGDLLAVRSAGAYAFSMSSNYNARPRAAELLVDGDAVHLARRRENIDDLLTQECVLPA